MDHHDHNRLVEDSLLGRVDQIQADLRGRAIPYYHLKTAGADEDQRDCASFAQHRRAPKAAGPLRPEDHGMGFPDGWDIEHPVAEAHHSLKCWN